MRETTKQLLSSEGVASGFASDMELHARISVVENRIDNAVEIAEKAMTKAESAVNKEALQSSIDSLREVFNKQIEASDKAVLKAEAATEKRFESVNEFRATLSDQQRDLATKSEVDLRFRGLEGRINAVVEDARESKGVYSGVREAKFEHRTEATDNRGTVFGVIGIVIALSAVIVAIFGHFMTR